MARLFAALCVALSVSSVSAQLPGTNFPPSLLQQQGMNDELKIKEDQQPKLAELTKELQEKFRADYAALPNVREVERLDRRRALDQKYYAAWSEAAGKVFTPDQMKRYQQCFLQQQGFNAMFNPGLQEKMGLNRDQVESLRQHAAYSDLLYKAAEQAAKKNPAKAQQEFATYLQRRDERMQQFLTPEQRTAWKNMTGKSYNFKPSFGR